MAIDANPVVLKSGGEYYLRHVAPEHYEVAKFLGTKQPVAVYTVRRMVCSCPGALFYKRCDHPQMVKSWISNGRPTPEMFDDPLKAQALSLLRRTRADARRQDGKVPVQGDLLAVPVSEQRRPKRKDRKDYLEQEARKAYTLVKKLKGH